MLGTWVVVDGNSSLENYGECDWGGLEYRYSRASGHVNACGMLDKLALLSGFHAVRRVDFKIESWYDLLAVRRIHLKIQSYGSTIRRKRQLTPHTYAITVLLTTSFLDVYLGPGYKSPFLGVG
jgi:hypothetical protein